MKPEPINLPCGQVTVTTATRPSGVKVTVWEGRGASLLHVSPREAMLLAKILHAMDDWDQILDFAARLRKAAAETPRP